MALALTAAVAQAFPVDWQNDTTSSVGDSITVAASIKAITPHSKKPGIAGGDAYPFLEAHLGWWWDYVSRKYAHTHVSTIMLILFTQGPKPQKSDSGKPFAPISVPVLWGDGHVDAQDRQRFEYFRDVTSKRTDLPYVMGFYEPDCNTFGSSNIPNVDHAVELWEKLVAPLKARGTKLGSPSMCSKCASSYTPTS